MEGTKKLAVDIPLSTRNKLDELAHKNKKTLTAMIIQLIEEGAKK